MKEWFYLLLQFEGLNPEVQQTIYRSFYSYVYKDIYYLLQDHAATEDMIQESFFKILSAVHKYDVKRILPWIRQVARNRALDYLKRIDRERHILYAEDVNTIESIYEASAARELPIDQHVEEMIRDELLYEAIAELKPDYRLMIMLYYVDERPLKKIAEMLGLAETAASQKLFRARKKLLQQFRRKWDR
ncbi:hypothetical protein PRECH8_26670 [Insulibacter thermoxylanivorax]|uniref:RNA polymerase sigma-70 factor, ECF subfamily n=1 Tax=Insulibacter thermoxylanivorax TaxID=2749268 RepID=A0A916QEM8_9BACL|nr:sigma-70 family RNA polymerase sigma factor [Insulibacter thermoxylanivorax]GFR39371.1 hypothetical protein PRECH8_26670 [Insulibacter thermoxylanivorax]